MKGGFQLLEVPRGELKCGCQLLKAAPGSLMADSHSCLGRDGEVNV